MLLVSFSSIFSHTRTLLDQSKALFSSSFRWWIWTTHIHRGFHATPICWRHTEWQVHTAYFSNISASIFIKLMVALLTICWTKACLLLWCIHCLPMASTICKKEMVLHCRKISVAISSVATVCLSSAFPLLHPAFLPNIIHIKHQCAFCTANWNTWDRLSHIPVSDANDLGSFPPWLSRLLAWTAPPAILLDLQYFKAKLWTQALKEARLVCGSENGGEIGQCQPNKLLSSASQFLCSF